MEIFKFEKNNIETHFRYEMKMFEKIVEPLNYIFKTLEDNGHSLTLKSLDKVNLNKVKQNKGKNYNWSVINYKNVKMLIRTYKQHLTIFTKVTKKIENKDGGREREKVELTAFTFHSDLKYFRGDKADRMSEERYENPFLDLNSCIKQMFEVIIDRGTYWVQNSACLKVPEHVEIRLAFSGESIHGFDNFIFCLEEIDSIYGQLFAENAMLKKLNDFKGGEKIGERYKVGKVTTKVKDDYFHGVGMTLIDTKGTEKESFKDVYYLTNWAFEDVFKEKTYMFNGELYVEGGELKTGEPAAYKNDDDFGNVIIFNEKYIKEKFVPLKKA